MTEQKNKSKTNKTPSYIPPSQSDYSIYALKDSVATYAH